jgi:hypothetical protein
MDVLTLIVTLVVIGFVLWLLTTYVPMPGAYKQVLVGIVILLVVLWLVRILLGPLPSVHVGR